jgi:hypothetical protein
VVAHLLATAALWVRIQTSPKNTIYKIGDISNRVANTAHLKKYAKPKRYSFTGGRNEVAG